MNPLREWMLDEEATLSLLKEMVWSRPVARAGSFVTIYRAYRTARDAEDRSARSAEFDDRLFHT